LSIAAQLAARGIEHRIIGSPMQFWMEHMPKGMQLKSEGFASSLYDASGHFTLRRYCAEHDLAYRDIGLPVPLDTFCRYGLAFQKRAVPRVENRSVVAVSRSGSLFAVELDNGDGFTARRVVVAVGVGPFSHLPEQLRQLPPELMSHSSAHHDLGSFRNKEVAVLGGGASAIDLAALLHEQGASVTLVARKPRLEIHTRMRLPRPLADRLREPMSGIGPSWRSWFFTNAPVVFHHLPDARRLKWVRNHLGPAGAWFMAGRVVGRVHERLGYELGDAQEVGHQVRLRLVSRDGSSVVLQVDHVIAATGFRPDLQRLHFLAPKLRAETAVLERMPILSSHFQASVPGLYFAGPISANSFGPVVRFAVGAKFTASRLSRHLAGAAALSARHRARPIVLGDLVSQGDGAE
jgi:thioredoxin reductase